MAVQQFLPFLAWVTVVKKGALYYIRNQIAKKEGKVVSYSKKKNGPNQIVVDR